MRPTVTRSILVSGVLLVSISPSRADKSPDAAWMEEYQELTEQMARARNTDRARRERLEAEALDPQALVQPTDRDPLDIVLRRSRAILARLVTEAALPPPARDDFRARLEALSSAAKAAGDDERRALYLAACELRRAIVFANPLLDFEAIVCMLEQPGEARIIEQARAVWPGHATGGGPIIVQGFRSRPEIVKPLAGVAVALGPWAGKELAGKFSGLELSYDGRRILFAATAGSEVWCIFEYDSSARRLLQLTHGSHDDFDPCYLPSGRIVFVSTRRGGIGRCVLTPQSLTYTLFSMASDGSDIVCLSYHETNEWQPTVGHDGKIVYTRWDYVDRYWGTAHHLWDSYPDGRDPRNLHGNYPLPWSAMPVGTEPESYGQRRLVDGRVLRPDVEISFRPVPGSRKYTATAVGHHEGFSGSLVLVDPTVRDDGSMSQVKRITPEYPFPEVEPLGVHAYGTAWPLSEDVYLVSFQTGLYLLDRFGNRELIHDPGDATLRVRDPFPLRARALPPTLAVRTSQGVRASGSEHRPAVLGVVNVYDSDEAGRLPAGTRIHWLRIVQVIPQMLVDACCSNETISLVSFADDSIGRIPLGIVPVEADGSVYCEAPVEKALYFQLLDEKGMAVQSMRSATYVHPGETLVCAGCHEDRRKVVRAAAVPMAFRRAPSPIVPEVEGGAIPFNFVQLVKEPVFDKHCVPCHSRHPDAPDMSYRSLARFDRAFSYPGEAGLTLLGVGGSRTTPGRFGAHASGIVKSLRTKEEHKSVRLSTDEWRRLVLWLDLNSNEIGWIGNDHAQIAAQKHGETLWPPIDVDPDHPSGVERRDASR